MLDIFGAIALISGFQVIRGQGFGQTVPNECKDLPVGIKETPADCCNIPPLFSDEDFQTCGFKKAVGAPKKSQPSDCYKFTCLLKKHNFLEGERNVNVMAIESELDKMVEMDETFEPAIATTKEWCLNDKYTRQGQDCAAKRIGMCITKTMLIKCSSWKKTYNCKKLEEHMELCMPYYYLTGI